MQPRAASLALAILVAGCSDPLADACGGARPEIGECARGLYFAECGGDGTDVLACSEGGGCLWFDGCVAEGYRPLDCPASDLCCHDTADGPWPWSDGWGAATQTSIDLAIVGAGPVTRAAPVGVSVTEVAEIDAPDSVQIACSAELELDVCVVRPSYAPRLFVGDAFVLELWSNYPFGPALQLEIVRAPGAAPIARVYVAYQAELPVDRSTCDSYEAGMSFTPLLRGGALTVAGLDGTDATAVHGEGTLEIGAAGALMIRF